MSRTAHSVRRPSSRWPVFGLLSVAIAVSHYLLLVAPTVVWVAFYAPPHRDVKALEFNVLSVPIPSSPTPLAIALIVAGVLFGLLGLYLRESRRWVAVSGMALNLLVWTLAFTTLDLVARLYNGEVF